MFSEIQPVVDELRNTCLRGAPAALVSRHNQVAEHMNGVPLMIVENFTLIRTFGGRSVVVACMRVCLRETGAGSGRGNGRRRTNDMEKFAAADGGWSCFSFLRWILIFHDVAHCNAG